MAVECQCLYIPSEWRTKRNCIEVRCLAITVVETCIELQMSLYQIKGYIHLTANLY